MSLLLQTVPAPAVVDAIIGRGHGAAAAGMDQEGHPAPRLRVVAILGGDEDQLGGGVIVRLEIMHKARIQTVARPDDRLCFGERSRIIRRGSVDARVQIQLGQ